MKITVLMPVYNEKQEFLEASMQSILAQNHVDIEFIIIDDGSTNPKTCSLLDAFSKQDSRIILIRNDHNIGLTKSLNIGIEKSTGEYLARMDSDDIAFPDRLKRQLSFLIAHRLDLIGGDCQIIDADGNILRKKTTRVPRDMRRSIFKGNQFTHSTLFGTRTVFQEKYNEDFRRAQDYEFLLRIIGKGYAVGSINATILQYRVNEDGISEKNAFEQELYALKARILALSKYGYGIRFLPFLLWPIASLCIPHRIKKFILHTLSK